MTDLREVDFFSSRHSTIRGCALLGCITILGVTGIRTFGPHPKVVNHTTTIVKKVENKPLESPVVEADEPDSELNMLQEEFDEIHVGDRVGKVLDKFPESTGNKDADNLTFWNRDGGGKFWVRWSKDKIGEQKVIRKWVENG